MNLDDLDTRLKALLPERETWSWQVERWHFRARYGRLAYTETTWSAYRRVSGDLPGQRIEAPTAAALLAAVEAAIGLDPGGREAIEDMALDMSREVGPEVERG